MTGLAVMYGIEMPDERIKVYWAMLQHYGEGPVIQALKMCAKTCKFFPVPADIISVLEGESSDTESAAYAAWSEVSNFMSSHIDTEALCQKDSRIAAGVNALGGWYTMANSDELPQWQCKTFVKAFMGENRMKQKRLLEIESHDSEVKGLIGNLADNMDINKNRKTE